MEHGNILLKDSDTGQYLAYNGHVFTFTDSRKEAHPFTATEAERQQSFWEVKLVRELWINQTWKDAAAK